MLPLPDDFIPAANGKLILAAAAGGGCDFSHTRAASKAVRGGEMHAGVPFDSGPLTPTVQRRTHFRSPLAGGQVVQRSPAEGRKSRTEDKPGVGEVGIGDDAFGDRRLRFL